MDGLLWLGRLDEDGEVWVERLLPGVLEDDGRL